MTMLKEKEIIIFKLLCISVRCMHTWVHGHHGIRPSSEVVFLPHMGMLQFGIRASSEVTLIPYMPMNRGGDLTIRAY